MRNERGSISNAEPRRWTLNQPRHAGRRKATRATAVCAFRRTRDLMSKIVSSLMQRRVRTIDMDDTIADVEGMFARERLSWAPVTTRGGEVVGVISAADVLQFHASGRDAA